MHVSREKAAPVFFEKTTGISFEKGARILLKNKAFIPLEKDAGIHLEKKSFIPFGKPAVICLSSILLLLLVSASPAMAVKHPTAVAQAITKAGNNGKQLASVLDAYAKSPKDSLKYRATCFLIEHMPVHRTRTYHWADSTEQTVAYNEFDYPDFKTAVEAFNKIALKGKLHPVVKTKSDLNTMSAAELKENIQQAFRHRDTPWNRNLNLKKADVTPLTQTKSRFYVYPNHFSEGINVSFFQQKEEKVSIQISTVNGKAVYQADLGKYPQGQQDITISLNLQPGAYILRLTTGKNAHQSVIIRK